MHRINSRFLLTATFAFVCLVRSGSAQGPDPDYPPKVVVPDRVMEEVVRRILFWQFKPARQPRKVYLSENGIKREWLPELKNIEFVLLDDNEVAGRPTGAWFFGDVTIENNRYSIQFGHGDPKCDATGHVWNFKTGKDTIRLWRTEGGWGSFCGTGSVRKIKGLKIGDVSPNELKGYEFFRLGRLQGIKLGVSTRDDIKGIFGDRCESPCDYDADWEIRTDYYDDGPAGTVTRSGGDAAVQTISYSVNPAFYGRLSSIRLTPKRFISFSRVIFPRQFSNGKTNMIADRFSIDGKFEGAVHSEFNNFTDGYGLSYEVFDAVTFHNIPVRKKRRKGELIGIEYNIPNAYETEIFTGTVIKRGEQ